MKVCELKVEGDSRRIEICVRWDDYYMKQCPGFTSVCVRYCLVLSSIRPS